MSVPVGLRGPQKLEVLAKTEKFAIDTIAICTNEKHFPKRIRWAITGKIVDCAENINSLAIKANSVYPSSWEDYLIRREFQIRAVAEASNLLSLVSIASAKGTFSLSLDVSENWIKEAVGIAEILSKWKTSDAARYSSAFHRNAD